MRYAITATNHAFTNDDVPGSCHSQVLTQREQIYPVLRAALCQVAEAHGERVLSTPGNPISVAMTLDRCAEVAAASGSSITFLGAMLWSR